MNSTNNLLYDLSQVAIPTDDVDAEQVARPRPWSVGQITRYILFMRQFGRGGCRDRGRQLGVESATRSPSKPEGRKVSTMISTMKAKMSE